MGIKRLERLDNFVMTRQKIKKHYIQGLTDLGFIVQHIDADIVHNVQSVVFKVPSQIDRNSLVLYLKSQDIEITIGTYCLSNYSYYKNKYNDVQSNAKNLFDTTITLPCYSGVDTTVVINKIKDFTRSLK